MTAAPAGRQSALVVHDGRISAKARTAFEDAEAGFLRLTGTADKDRVALTAALGRFGNGDVNVIYLPDTIEGDGSQRLQRSVVRLGMVADVLRAHARSDGPAMKNRLAVVIEAEETAHHASGSDAGLWAFCACCEMNST